MKVVAWSNRDWYGCECLFAQLPLFSLLFATSLHVAQPRVAQPEVALPEVALLWQAPLLPLPLLSNLHFRSPVPPITLPEVKSLCRGNFETFQSLLQEVSCP